MKFLMDLWYNPKVGACFLNSDSDRDGVIDSEDKFPLDSAKTQASLIEAVKFFAKDKGIPTPYLIGGAIFIFLLIFVFFRRRG